MSAIVSPPPVAKDRTRTVLRSSCDTCAASKIRCSKEKPECVRCTKRGLTCSYSVPRRPGRPSHKTTSANSTATNSPSPGRPRSVAADSQRTEGICSIHIDTEIPSPPHGPPSVVQKSTPSSTHHTAPTACSQTVGGLAIPNNGLWSLHRDEPSIEPVPPFDMSGSDSCCDVMDLGAYMYGNLDPGRYDAMAAHPDPLSVVSHPLGLGGCLDYSAQSPTYLSFANVHPLDIYAGHSSIYHPDGPGTEKDADYWTAASPLSASLATGSGGDLWERLR